MKTDFLKVVGPALVKTVLPPILGAAGALVAVIWAEGFHAFCGAVL